MYPSHLYVLYPPAVFPLSALHSSVTFLSSFLAWKQCWRQTFWLQTSCCFLQQQLKQKKCCSLRDSQLISLPISLKTNRKLVFSRQCWEVYLVKYILHPYKQSYCLYKSPNYPVLHEVDQNKPRRVKTQLCFLFMPWIFSKFGFRSWSDSWSETTIKKKDKPCPPCAVLHFGIHCEILAVWLNWVKLWYSENVDSLLYIVRGTWYNIDNSLAHFLHQKLSKHDAELIEAGGKSDFFPCHSLTLQTFLKYPRQRGPRSVYPQPNLLCG